MAMEYITPTGAMAMRYVRNIVIQGHYNGALPDQLNVLQKQF